MCNPTLGAVTAFPLCLCGRGHLCRQPWLASSFREELPGVTVPSLKSPTCIVPTSGAMTAGDKDEGQDIQYDSTALSICMIMRRGSAMAKGATEIREVWPSDRFRDPTPPLPLPLPLPPPPQQPQPNLLPQLSWGVNGGRTDGRSIERDSGINTE